MTETPQDPTYVEPTDTRPAVAASEAPSVQDGQGPAPADTPDGDAELVVVKVVQPADVDRFVGYRQVTRTDENGQQVQTEEAVVVDRAGAELDPEFAATLRDNALAVGVVLTVETKG